MNEWNYLLKTGIEEKVTREGIKILYRNLSPGLRGSVFQKNGQWFIIVNQDDSVERKNFTIAHEYFEIQLFEREDISNDEKHHFANQMASEYFLPEDAFSEAIHKNNLFELKEIFTSVSFEVIARRIPHFLPVIVSILDNKQVTSRFGSPDINFPQAISEPELKAANLCYDSKEIVKISDRLINITGYYLDDPASIERVIVIAEVDINGE